MLVPAHDRDLSALRARLAHHEYEVDPRAVAAELLRRWSTGEGRRPVRKRPSGPAVSS